MSSCQLLVAALILNSKPSHGSYRFSSHAFQFHPHSSRAKPKIFRGRQAEQIQVYCVKCHKNGVSAFERRQSLLLKGSLFDRVNRKHYVNFSDKSGSDYLHLEPPNVQRSSQEIVPSTQSDSAEILASPDANNFINLDSRPKKYKNRFLNFVRMSSVLNGIAESFFKSEIRRRLFVTAVLIVLSRVGYFVPLPGFDRRLIPRDYLSFVSGSVDELGDYSSELKLSLFQLGISPQIIASIIMQVLCHVVPSLVKLRKEGLDGHEKIKSYMCVHLTISAMVDVTWLCNFGSSNTFLLLTSIFNLCCQSKGQACDGDNSFVGVRCNDYYMDM